MSDNWLTKYRLTIKRPKAARKSFDIIVDAKSPNSRSQDSIKKIPKFHSQSEALNTLNVNLQKGLVTENDVEVNIKAEILPTIEKVLKIGKSAIHDAVINEANQKVVNAYLKEKYSSKRIIDKNRAVHAFNYAIKILEKHSLLSTDEKTLQNWWDSKLSGTAHRRYGRCLNSLMKYLGRDFKIQLDKNSHYEMRYGSLDEVLKIAKYYDDVNLQNLIVTMFCIGTREGETFAITEKSLRASTYTLVFALNDFSVIANVSPSRVPIQNIVTIRFCRFTSS